MSQLSLIIKTELFNDLRSKGFWIGTFAVPLLVIVFGFVVGFMSADSETLQQTSQSMSYFPDEESLTGAKLAGMACGMGLTFFLMIYGAMIFNKVKAEKTNRIMEIICTCVDGRTMMFAKIISVGITGIVQLVAWSALIIVGVTVLFMMFPFAIPWDMLAEPRVYLGVLYLLLYFIGGYILFASLYAACGAITDKDNENQTYMTCITFLLLAAFYAGPYAVDHGTSALTTACALIPFTAPTVGLIGALSGDAPIWLTILSLGILYASGFVAVSIAGKLYRSSMMLKGKNLTPKDLITFIRLK